MEDVVVSVVPPELEVCVAQGVVEELEQVADHPGEEEGEDVVGDRPTPPPTEGLAVAGLGQLQRHRRADGGAQHPLHHLDYLVPHLLWAGELANSNVTTQ